MIAPLEVVAQGILRRTTIGNTHFSYTYLRQGLLPTSRGCDTYVRSRFPDPCRDSMYTGQEPVPAATLRGIHQQNI